MPLTRPALARAMLLAVATAATLSAGAQTTAPARSVADILKDSKPTDWRPLDPQNTLVMEFKGGQVIIELAPRFAPQSAANIRTLAREGFYSKSSVIRVQDNYVTQWGDPNDEDKAKALPLGSAKTKVPAEFSVSYKDLPITKLADTDEWAAVTGFVDGMPAAANPAKDQAWLPHCYGVVGVARGTEADSGTGVSLYVIIGQAPRRLDLNITTVGRVLKGMELLSALPRGTGNLGFYDKPEQHIPLGRTRLLADIPAAERPALEVMRTDTPAFAAVVEAGRNPASDWFVYKPGHTNVCNVNVPTRTPPAKP